MAEWVKVCELDELNDTGLVDFDFDNKKVLISKVKDKVYATDRICTHAYADLSTGFINEEAETITCPLHMSSFELAGGAPQNLPAEVPLKTYSTKIEDKSVYIFLDLEINKEG
ncbi:MAG TPA: non-heme iron oxygenase ferredoxin subunit [Candidatus Nitrosopolaris sp.]|nr:non-heme iron oxygenase ferredoxin subunit [Candidatus Nitrosopolaris sp.]